MNPRHDLNDLYGSREDGETHPLVEQQDERGETRCGESQDGQREHEACDELSCRFQGKQGAANEEYHCPMYLLKQ